MLFESNTIFNTYADEPNDSLFLLTLILGRDGGQQNLQGPESQPGQREAHGGVRAVSQRRECLYEITFSESNDIHN